MNKIQGSSSSQQVAFLPKTDTQNQNNTAIQTTNQPTIRNTDSLTDTQATKNGINLNPAAVQIARAAPNSDVENIVNKLTAQPPQAGVRDLINDLNNAPSDYQATVINRLIEKNPQRAASLLSQGASSDVLAKSLSNAYNQKAENGGNASSSVYNLIKNGISPRMTTADENAYNIGNLVAKSGNQNLIRDFANDSLTYAHQLRGTSPVGDAVSASLANGALSAASGDGSVLKTLINSGKITDQDISSSALSGKDSLGKALDTAAKGGFGTNFFLSVAGKSGQVNSENVKNSMVKYFNTMGGQVLNRLTASGDGSANSAKLSEFFGKIALPDANRRSSVFSANGGFGKAFAAALGQVDKPVTGGTALGNLMGSLERGLGQFKTSTEDATKLKDQVIGLLGKIPFAGSVVSSVAKNAAANLANSPVKNSQQLATALNSSILNGLLQGAQKAEGEHNPQLRDNLIQLRTQYSTERTNFLDTHR